MKVGNGSLEYVVGVLEYVDDPSLNSMTEITAIAMGSLAGVIIMVVLASLGGFLLKHCPKRWVTTPTTQYMECFSMTFSYREIEEVPPLGGSQNAQEESVRPDYDYVSHEHVYEDINDISVNAGREWVCFFTTPS